MRMRRGLVGMAVSTTSLPLWGRQRGAGRGANPHGELPGEEHRFGKCDVEISEEAMGRHL